MNEGIEEQCASESEEMGQEFGIDDDSNEVLKVDVGELSML